MKFEDLLMQPSDQQKQRRIDLEAEVEELQEDLDTELKLNKILHCALQGSVQSWPCLSKLIPHKAQELLAEVATLEKEINWLERKMDELKSSLHQEKKQVEGKKEGQMHRKQKKQLSNYQINRTYISGEVISRPRELSKHKGLRERKTSFNSSLEILSLPSMKFSGKFANYFAHGHRSMVKGG